MNCCSIEWADGELQSFVVVYVYAHRGWILYYAHLCSFQEPKFNFAKRKYYAQALHYSLLYSSAR